MILSVQHIGIGVRDLDAMVHFYGDILGLPVEDRPDWAALGLRAAVLPVGNTKLELIEPTQPQGEIAETLARLVEERGGGIHHLAFEVDDLEETLAALKAAGVALINETPVESASGRLAWLKETDTPGTMIELVEKGYHIS